jgi:hypothetical protein
MIVPGSAIEQEDYAIESVVANLNVFCHQTASAD